LAIEPAQAVLDLLAVERRDGDDCAHLMRRNRQVVWNDSFLADEEARVLDPEAQLKYFGQPTELS
jgi:hypothetical protein